MSKKKPAIYQEMTLRAYCRATGHRAETIRAHARLYGLATSGKEIVPTTVCMTAHDFFANNAALLRRMRESDGDESRAEAERRKAIATADREELKAAREKHLVVDRAEAEQHGIDLVRYFCAACERAAVDLAALLAAAEKNEVRAIVDAYFDRLRNDMSAGKPIQVETRS